MQFLNYGFFAPPPLEKIQLWEVPDANEVDALAGTVQEAYEALPKTDQDTVYQLSREIVECRQICRIARIVYHNPLYKRPIAAAMYMLAPHLPHVREQIRLVEEREKWKR